MTNLGAHIIDQVLWIMNVKGPSMVMSTGGRYALEDDGETPDSQDAVVGFPHLHHELCHPRSQRLARRSRGARPGISRNQGIDDPGRRLRGDSREQKIDPVNDIRGFMGQPIGGPVYTNVKPTPWIQASKGGVASDARYGTGGEDTMAMNERDWLNSIRTPQTSAVRGGGRPSRGTAWPPGQYVSAAGPGHQMGPRERTGDRRQGSGRHVRPAVPGALGWRVEAAW